MHTNIIGILITIIFILLLIWGIAALVRAISGPPSQEMYMRDAAPTMRNATAPPAGNPMIKGKNADFNASTSSSTSETRPPHPWNLRSSTKGKNSEALKELSRRVDEFYNNVQNL